MLKKKTVFFVVLVLVLVVVGVVIGVWVAGGTKDGARPSGYAAVYMTNGTVYFGKIHTFPSFRLSEALVLQQGAAANGQQSGLSLVPFKSAFWGPVGDMYINKSQMVFWAPIRSDSQVAQVLADPSLLLQNQNQQGMTQNQPSVPPPTTSTDKTQK